MAYDQQLADALKEIERLRAAKRGALAIADERIRENVALRAVLLNKDSRSTRPLLLLGADWRSIMSRKLTTMAEWRPIETAPRDRRILLYGQLRPMEGLKVKGPEVFTGYYDAIDDAWCGSGSTWEGPFYDPTHWMPSPDPPST